MTCWAPCWRAAAPAVRLVSSPPSPQCAIKGNINAKGEKIFHVPGGRSYDATDIVLAEGEKWFCSEKEALAAGWRAAKN
jgi:micrococcal nuclease